MTDIVERLRQFADYDVDETARDGTLEASDIRRWSDMMREAANEIERLRSSLDDAFSAYFQTNDVPKAVKAENEACARLVEEAASVTFDAGPPAPGKVLSGTVTITNIHTGVSQAAAAIRARMEAKP